MPDYEVAVNERRYPVATADAAALDLIETAPATYHLLHNGQSYRVEAVQLDIDRKTLLLRLNGREHRLQLDDSTDLLVRRLGLSVVNTAKSKNAEAPMPGLVLELLVAEGDPVEPGTPLVILEAMKMENVLKAEGAGTVSAIRVAQGDAVEKRQVLIEID